jgi:predicted phosphodiesterase
MPNSNKKQILSKKEMKTKLFIFVLFFSFKGIAQDFNIQYGPYLQNTGENEVTVVWVTSSDALGWVEIAPDDSMSFYARPRPQYFQTESGKKRIGRLHKVTVKGLEKGTSYLYRVYAREVLDATTRDTKFGKTVATDGHRRPLKFKTFDSSTKEARFAVINDIHADNRKLETLLNHADRKNTDFIFYNGDMMSELDSEALMFKGFINTSVKIFASRIPFFMARGNHETRGPFSTEYMNYFPSSTGKPYYHFRHGPAFFIVLDSGEDKPDSDIEYGGLSAFDSYREEQVQWLEEVLRSESFRQAPKKIVIIHIPAFTSTWYGTQEVERLFYPLLNKAGIDIMFCGHLHRHVFLPKDARGNVFPILTNSSKEVFEVTVDEKNITIKITDLDGNVTENLQF